MQADALPWKQQAQMQQEAKTMSKHWKEGTAEAKNNN